MLVVIVTSGVTTVLAASAACLVTNSDTSQNFTALQPAVDAASPGHRLTVEGTCHGITVIEKDLVISGFESETSGRPILDGDGLGAVVTVLRAAATLENLTIEDGGSIQQHAGGGLTNKLGTLTLRDVIVRGNQARFGGGIYNTGTLTLRGASRISGNKDRRFSGMGGGVYNRGTLTMHGASSISGNDARAGGGVFVDGGRVVMNDHSVISDNGGGIRADDGTVVLNDSSSIRGNAQSSGIRLFGESALTMNDSSTVTGNASGREGGGVELYEGSVLSMNDSSTITLNRAGIGYRNRNGGGVSSYGGRVVGVICAPKANANVFDNSPDDCLLADRDGRTTR